MAASCRASNGDFDPTTQKCKIIKECPKDQYLAGFDSLGAPICEANRFLNVGCGPGFSPVKVLSGGGFECWKF